jgi:peptidoglycan hydrolase CwlO-like protein
MCATLAIDILPHMDIVCNSFWIQEKGGGIMKKAVALLFLAVLIIGCGPKMAKQETLDALAEARAALEAAQTRLDDLQAERDQLEARRTELEQMMQDLQAEIDMLQNNIDTRCGK